MADANSIEDSAYPNDLKVIEENLLCKRQGLNSRDQIKNKVGFGLSGGGIRSATFCLGLFQGLAKQHLLSKIDYLSTVSGGGYFGAFYGRLFTREQVTDMADVETALTSRNANQEKRHANGDGAKNKLPEGKVFRWLRENGRYLAPNGSGDLLLGGAVFTRNLLAVQLVLLTFALMFFLTAQLIRGVIELNRDRLLGVQHYLMPIVQGLPSHSIWWSPYILVFPIVLALFVIPPAWSYWLVERPNGAKTGIWIPPVYGLYVLAILCVLGIRWDFPPPRAPSSELINLYPLFWLSLAVLIVAVETRIWLGVTRIFQSRSGIYKDPIWRDENLRLRFSLQLKTALIVAGASLAFILIDSLAQTIYGASLLGEFRIKLWTTAAFGSLVAAAGFARTVIGMFSNNAQGKRFTLPVRLIAGVGALLVAAVLFIALDVCAYAIAWNLHLPLGPRPDWTSSEKLRDASRLAVTPNDAGWSIVASKPVVPTPKPLCGPPAPVPTMPSCGSRESLTDLTLLIAALCITLTFSVLFGWSWPFLNRSTQHPMYTSRLIRAYLGASNPERLKATGESVTQAIPGDDIPQEKYWARHLWLKFTADKEARKAGKQEIFQQTKASIEASEKEIFERKKAPLHLVNVTINETLDARSQVEQQDRKGVGMAIGPAGISAGVFHHVVAGVEEAGASRVKVYPQSSDPSGAGDASTPKKVYQIFRYQKKNGFNAEFLSLGNWIAISGAAFSTSLGSRTSLGFSFLAGLANVRLTYWWDSGVEPLDRLSRAISKRTAALANSLGKMLSRRAASDSSQEAPDGYLSPEPTRPIWRRLISGIFQFSFAVQSFLLDELFARFHGTARRWWPLSDGGHFENMGGYELIRRRLPMIVIVDAEADPGYTFEGLANLIRKARLDFGAEIRFLNEDGLKNRIHPDVRNFFGTLEQLRRGTWVKEPVEDPNAPKPATGTSRRERLSINPVDEQSLSLAHAALAEVSYTAPDGKGILLYIKPTLMGDEPADVRRYHTEHPSFPHETTAQQFFDEAQWESYRRLGEHIADKIFRDHDDEGNVINPENGKFLPYVLEK